MSEHNPVEALLALLTPEQKLAAERQMWQSKDTDLIYDGTKIVLPATPQPMSLQSAIDTLKRKLDDENQMLDIVQWIEGYPFDSAVAFVKAMAQKYGWASPVPTPGFFGPKNPTILTVKTGPEPEDTIQVPMGSFKIPGVENAVQLQMLDGPTGELMLVITGKARKREKAVIMELVAIARHILERESIYKGKAIRLGVDNHGRLNRGLEPTFIPTKHVREDELILSDNVRSLMETSLFTPIRKTADCVRYKIPLKRGILLEGPYGVGKSMTAAVCSRVCVDNGWTFVMLDKVQGLKAALEFARQYQPAVVFAEDIDRITEERDEKANDLLNMIDGVLGKEAKVITVLTTNHVDRISQAMLRPGRLDAVISVTAPDADAAIRLVRLYARDLIRADEPLTELGMALSGNIPATIREVVERSKLAMISRGGHLLIEADLLLANEGMKKHLELLNRPVTRAKSPGDRIAEALGEVVRGADGGDNPLPEIAEEVSDIGDTVEVTHKLSHQILETIQGQSNGTGKSHVSAAAFKKLAEKVDQIHDSVVTN